MCSNDNTTKEDTQNEDGKKCGEVFLTFKRTTVYHCTLCERKYDEIQNFGVHIIDKHSTDFPDIFHIPKVQIERIFPKIPEVLLKKYSSFEVLNEFNFQENLEVTDLTNHVDEITLTSDNGYDKQCGQVHFTKKGILIFRCIICENTFKGIKDYHQHVDSHNLLGSVVNKNYSVSNSFVHNKSPENIQNEKKLKKVLPKWKETFEPFYCPKSNQTLYKCKLCSTVIKDKTNINHHIRRVHEKLKRYECTECQRLFHSNTELKIHRRHHTGEKPYLCFECGMAFISSSELQMHKKKKHIDLIRDKPCSICGKTFTSQRNLSKHKTVHSEERPFKCKVCDAKFKVKSSLTLHNRIHEDKRAFKCNICSASYNYKSILKSHMQSKHALALE